MQKRIARFLTALACVLAIGAALAEDYPLIVNMGVDGAPDFKTVASLQAPEGFAHLPEAAVESDEPEYYFAPTDAQSPVRFLYYTTGHGDPQALAEAALQSYAMFYEEFQPGEVVSARLGDRDCMRFDYVCGYPGPDGKRMVYEQTAVCYFPLDAERFLACIVSLAFDDAGDRWEAEALEGLLKNAADAIAFAE